MIRDIVSICSKRHKKYLILLLIGMIFAAAIEMVGLGSIPMFIMMIIDFEVLINKFPNFFTNSYIKSIEQNHITIFGGIFLIIIFLIKNIYLAVFLFFQGKVIKILKYDITSKLFKNYINAAYSFHIKNNPAILIRNITQSAGLAVSTILYSLTIMRETLVLFVIFVLLFFNEPIISITVFIFLIVFIIDDR